MKQTERLLDGTQIEWDIISGRHDPALTPDPLVLQRVRERRAAAASTLPPPVLREPQAKRLVAGGMFVAGAVAAHWRRGRS